MKESSNPLIQSELEAADNDDFSLIDGSSLDDLLDSMSETSFVDNEVNIKDGVNKGEKPETALCKKNQEYNPRTSLPWDSAFNCAGLLDAEELSRIIEGSNSGRHQMQHLSGIQDDISKSTDSSLSTLESDNLSLDSLEADLFCDTRPSIQGSGESSKLRKLNSNRGPEGMDSRSLSGRKSTSLHGNMVKQKSVSRKPNASIQGDVRLIKLCPVHEHVGKHGGSKREPQTSLSKLPATSDGKNLRAMTAVKLPNKRTPIATGRKNSSLNNVGNTMAAGTGTKVSKGPHPGDSYSTIPTAALSAKSSSQSSTSRIGTSSARSSFDSTTSSNVSSRISPLNGKQGKSDRSVSIPPSSFRSRLPSRVPLKGTIQSKTSCTSAYQSTPKDSPSSSPTSSICEWSSSSSVATVNQEHYVSKGCSNMLRTASLESLAWDSSFNCAGSNSGRHQMQHLSRIQEYISKSTDSSLSNLESDNLTLESIEADLFCDTRPSIQGSGESSKLRKLNSDRGPEEMDSGSPSGTKSTFLHGNMKSVSRKPNASIQGDARLMKLDPVREHVGKPGSSKREPQTFLSKLPAASDGKYLRAMTAAKLPNKRMPIATGRKNSSLNNVGNTMAAGIEAKVSEGPHPGDSYSAIPKAAPSAKSSSHSSTSRIGTSSTRSSFDSTSSSSVSSRMLPLNGKQGKSDRTVSIPPSSFRSRLPSRVPLKGTIQPRTSCTSAYQSTPKDLLVHHLLVL